MNEGLDRFVVNVSSGDVDGYPLKGIGYEEVNMACSEWLEKRGMRTDGEMQYAAMIERRRERALQQSREIRRQRRGE